MMDVLQILEWLDVCGARQDEIIRLCVLNGQGPQSIL